MHRAGVKIAMEEERSSYVVPKDMPPYRLVKAEVLDLSGVPLYDIPAWFAHFTHLRNLNLADTKIDIDDLLRLGNISRLEILYLSNNDIFGNSDPDSLEKYRRFFAKLSNLRRLDLQNTRINSDSAVSLAHLARLQVLNLKNNTIRRLKGMELSRLQALKELYLDGNSLNSEFSDNNPSFTNFPSTSLEILSLSGCGISSGSLEGAFNMPELRSLDMSNNNIEEFPFLGDLPNLEILNLSKNPSYKSSSSVRLSLNERYGGLFVFQNLKNLAVDDNARVPKNLQDRLEAEYYAGFGSADYTNSIGMQFVRIPAGAFMMGSSDGDSNEKPIHKVTIGTAFLLGRFEVTQAQWEAVMGNTPSSFKGRHNPVERVSWDDVQNFIKKLNAKEGHNRYRLPTEAEWEYAARAGTQTKYSFGDDASRLGDYAWYGDNSGGRTHPVGKKPNAWGLYDMHGNVWEWVQDWYGSDYYSNSPSTDPKGPSSGSNRVSRGGSWLYSAGKCRSANRDNYSPGIRSVNIGFRLLLSPK